MDVKKFLFSFFIFFIISHPAGPVTPHLRIKKRGGTKSASPSHIVVYFISAAGSA